MRQVEYFLTFGTSFSRRIFCRVGPNPPKYIFPFERVPFGSRSTGSRSACQKSFDPVWSCHARAVDIDPMLTQKPFQFIPHLDVFFRCHEQGPCCPANDHLKQSVTFEPLWWVEGDHMIRPNLPIASGVSLQLLLDQASRAVVYFLIIVTEKQ